MVLTNSERHLTSTPKQAIRSYPPDTWKYVVYTTWSNINFMWYSVSCNKVRGNVTRFGWRLQWRKVWVVWCITPQNFVVQYISPTKYCAHMTWDHGQRKIKIMMEKVGQMNDSLHEETFWQCNVSHPQKNLMQCIMFEKESRDIIKIKWTWRNGHVAWRRSLRMWHITSIKHLDVICCIIELFEDVIRGRGRTRKENEKKDEDGKRWKKVRKIKGDGSIKGKEMDKKKRSSKLPKKKKHAMWHITHWKSTRDMLHDSKFYKSNRERRISCWIGKDVSTFDMIKSLGIIIKSLQGH